MDEKEMRRKIAYLEFANDQLVAEMQEMDEIMRLVGFTNGLDTVKETAWHLYYEENESEEEL